ncbi:uncharacterized protein LOC118644940 [Monomorium pharaonis]|uniref:uncharacterized protein LOC118644940 n=1 Tax=Monomorium pharaonis TaxID=307658 RepID=UPI001746E296|nr:uncharacterized protein LOC118644940 [Monomorium pharaonis]XP_036140792.1 uncharacterized protein LOC118644940 [Monomorium pharaonis]XP_036140793.1 uncharacterized protein LOC118644940 [Monomorium pharaonis]
MSFVNDMEHENFVMKRKYNIWRNNPYIPIPLRNLQRWKRTSDIDKPGCSTIPITALYENEYDCCTRNNELNTLDSENRDYNYTDKCEANNSLQNNNNGLNLKNDNKDNENHELNNSDNFERNFDGRDNNNTENNINNIQMIDNLLYKNSEITVSQSVLIIMNLYIHNKLTKAALTAILKALQLVLPKPNNMPKTQFHLFQFVRNLTTTCTIIKHYYCRQCLFYNGSDSSMTVCPSCSSIESMWHFYEFDLVDIIRYMFEVRNLADKLHVPFSDNNLIFDITDGSEYIRVNSRRNKQQYDLTLILNTDGLSLVKSAKSHCWPLMFTIAELPEHLRESFIVIVGLWYDTNSKPLMNTFLQPFCKKLNECFHNGISWIHPTTKKVYTSKIVAPLIIADAPARAQIQNILSFNGKFGCNICEIKTKQCRTIAGKKIIRVYAFQEEPSKLRSGKRMKKQARIAITKEVHHVKGVKGNSVISTLPLLDLGTCVMPEYMHSILLGTVKQLFNLWFFKRGTWNIKEYVEEIDNFLLNIRPPYFFNRMPRSVKLHAFFKASEYYNWILYYSIPTIVNCLPNKYFQHWLLLVISLFNLLQKPIRIYPELEQTEILLKLFVRDIGKLYGDGEYSYNVHQLLHIVLCVKRWGPLWATSVFPFENYNNFLANCIHGSQNLGQEMINNLTLVQGLQVLQSQYGHNEDTFNNKFQIKTYALLGKSKEVKDIDDIEIRLIESKNLQLKNLCFYARAKINNEMYTSQIYKATKTNSYTVQVIINDNQTLYGSIRFFFEIENNLYFILQYFTVEHTKMFVHFETNTIVKHIVPVKEENQFILLKVNDLIRICHVIRVGSYICKRPNTMKKVM